MTNIVDIVDEIQELMSFQAKHKNIELKKTILISNQERYIYQDAYRLKQIILNFVSNALKFTQSGYVEIKVEAVESGSDKSKALL